MSQLYPLHEAVRKSDLVGVKKLLDSGVDVNQRDDYNYTPLMNASFIGNRDIINLLIKSKADINLRRDGVEEPTEEAISYGICSCNCGRTALHMAAQYGHLETVKLLYTAGGDVKIKDGMSNTVLMLAATSGNLELVKYLISLGLNHSERNKNEFDSLAFAMYLVNDDSPYLSKSSEKEMISYIYSL